jgi:hypothetical protein
MNATMGQLPICQVWQELKLVTVFAAYEDSPTAQRVVEFCRALAQHVCPECTITRHVWLITEFRAPALKQMAAEEAAVADVLVISVHRRETVPRELKDLLDLWLTFKTGRPSVLLALLDPAALGSPNSVETYLAGIARREHMEFLIESVETQNQQTPEHQLAHA